MASAVVRRNISAIVDLNLELYFLEKIPIVAGTGK
jgi:hypothetical protein